MLSLKDFTEDSPYRGRKKKFYEKIVIQSCTMSAPCSLTEIILFIISFFLNVHLQSFFSYSMKRKQKILHHLSFFLRINFHPKANKSWAIKHNILNQIRNTVLHRNRIEKKKQMRKLLFLYDSLTSKAKVLAGGGSSWYML